MRGQPGNRKQTQEQQVAPTEPTDRSAFATYMRTHSNPRETTQTHPAREGRSDRVQPSAQGITTVLVKRALA